jgi:hypothetical protein
MPSRSSRAKIDRLLAEAEALAARVAAAGPTAYEREYERRWHDLFARLAGLVPADLQEAVADHLQAVAARRGGPFECGGLWDWLTSLFWCHSAIPPGLTEAAVRETVRRFLRYADGSHMVSVCVTCGLATPARWAGLPLGIDWRTVAQEPCAHCGGRDLVELCGLSRRGPHPWDDDWARRAQECPGGGGPKWKR